MNSKRLIVNALTFTRVPLIFLWAVLAIVQELRAVPGQGGSIVLGFVAGLAMFLSGITDLYDGKLARKWGVVSALGKMADPLMDKVFYIVAFPTLMWQILHQSGAGAGLHALVMLGFTILYMLRDSWVTFLRSVGSLYGADVAAMWLGKVRTALSFPGAGWIYTYLVFAPHCCDVWEGVLTDVWLMSCFAVEAILAVLTLWSLVTYTSAYWPYLKKALERH